MSERRLPLQQAPTGPSAGASTVPASSQKTVPPTIHAGLPQRRSRQHRLLMLFCGVSLGFHLGAVAAYVLWPNSTAPVIDLDAISVKTRLVKLGKPRDEKLLPRMPTSPPQPAADKAPPAPNNAPEAPSPDASKRPTAAEILSKFEKDNAKATDIKDLIRDRIGEQTDEGKLEGDKDGSDLDGEIQASYFQRVIAHIRRNMELSSVLTDDERIRLKATLALQIGSAGEILSVRIQKSSGSSVFDSDVVTAAKKASPVPAPPPPVRALAEKGIGINFCPTSCS